MWITNVIISGLVMGVPAWVIFRRAGLKPAMSLIVLIPVIGPLFALVLLAFTPWPATEEGGGHGN
jgi:hypothetical protein